MKWTKFDTRWMLSLFGTAVGAGILFLPIRAGTGGFWPVVVMTILIFPMVWLSHRALSRFVNESQSVEHDITHAAEEYWGRNTSFFINQLQLTSLYDSQTMQLYPSVRAILAFVLVSAMMSIMLLKEETITKACNILVYPLCLVLFAFSFYLIPHWKLEIIQTAPSAKDFIEVVWLTLPVLVFSFNHSPAISTFTLSVRREYGEASSQKANQILFRTAVMLLIFVMFFVFSCILCLDSTDFQAAREANIPILSYFANKLNVPFIAYGAPLVAFLAIVTSFFGHYFGAYEGLNGILRKAIKMSGNENPNIKGIKIFSTIFMYVTIIVVAYLNPSILGFIEDLGGPIIAMILFIMPMIAIWGVSKLKKYKNPALDIFVIITGILTITSVVYKLL